jgi:hypothetical protein
MSQILKEKKSLKTTANSSKAVSDAQPGALNIHGLRSGARMRSLLLSVSVSDFGPLLGSVLDPDTVAVAIERTRLDMKDKNLQVQHRAGHVSE